MKGTKASPDASVEPERELVEVVLQMLETDRALVGPQQPAGIWRRRMRPMPLPRSSQATAVEPVPYRTLTQAGETWWDSPEQIRKLVESSK
jgi:hypothetical protein